MEEEKKESDLASELKRIRSRHKVLKIVTALLSASFIIVILAAAFIYHKIAGLRDMFAEAGNSFSEAASGAQNLPLPRLPAGAYNGMPLSTQSAGSSLMMLTGLGFSPADLAGAGSYAAGNPGLTAADGGKIMRAFSKYADRPIVRDFMEELKKDPDFQRALKEKAANNPIAAFSYMVKAKSMEKLAMKFVLRPDFMPFMTEVMNDPQMKPLTSQFPSHNMGTAAHLSVRRPAAVPPETGSGRQEANENADISFDSSALEGAQKAPSVPLKKNAPPPVSE